MKPIAPFLLVTLLVAILAACSQVPARGAPAITPPESQTPALLSPTLTPEHTPTATLTPTPTPYRVVLLSEIRTPEGCDVNTILKAGTNCAFAQLFPSD